MPTFLSIHNAQPVRRTDIPVMALEEFRTAVADKCLSGCRISAFCPLPADGTPLRQLLTVLINPETHLLELASFTVNGEYPALTTEIPAFHWFERELHELTGISPIGHPWLKPIRFCKAENQADHPEIGVTDYFTLEGNSAHEVAVGPVHAGVIEPGHFRFQCMGEDVFSLEIELGYQHRGIEKLLVGGPNGRTRHFIETASGDASIAQALCYHSIIEHMTGLTVTPRAQALRSIALELERIANHIGDLGALAGDVAFLPTASYCGRIRGDFLNMTATLCGNRFGRGYITPAAIRYPLADDTRTNLLKRLDAGEADLNSAIDIMFEEPTVLDRFENTGTVTRKTATDIGAVGMAARASGIPMDCRKDIQSLSSVTDDFDVACAQDGDVLSRTIIRRKELATSIRMLRKMLTNLPGTPADGVNNQMDTNAKLPGDTLCIAIAEAWRGELCHLALTNTDGTFAMYKIIDPSFHNWFALALALRSQQIADFPICNKSFNLSYCGHDL